LTQTKNLLFTFDYELFLGSTSGTVQKCLIEPTNYLLNLFDTHKIKNAVFFVDTTYLLRLREETHEACKKDYLQITQQLTDVLNRGHYVFPHIHPHWIDAKYNKELNQWHLDDYSKYRFHNIEPEVRETLFYQSMDVIEKIMMNANLQHKIDGYRAGGWSIQPFSDFKPCFEKFGIAFEFSVMKDFKNLSEAQYFDFSNCPEKNSYKFSTNPCMEDVSGNYTEYTISTLSLTTTMYWLNKVWAKYLWKTGQRSLGDGSGLVIKAKEVTSTKKDMLGSDSKEMISIELLNTVKLPYYKNFLKRNSYMHFISHPKMLSLHNLKIFEAFLKHATAKYKLQTNFKNFN
jgi:hypothetical protein